MTGQVVNRETMPHERKAILGTAGNSNCQKPLGHSCTVQMRPDGSQIFMRVGFTLYHGID